jgi:hypothetical protein
MSSYVDPWRDWGAPLIPGKHSPKNLSSKHKTKTPTKRRSPTKKPSEITALRLVTKKSVLAGHPKVASSSDGHIDHAVAVHIGVEENTGLPSIAYAQLYRRATRLAIANTVQRVRIKPATQQHRHTTAELRRIAAKALPAVLVPAYIAAHRHLPPPTRLNDKKMIRWVRQEVKNRKSPLCLSLLATEFEPLEGLDRNERWWSDLSSQKKMQSNHHQ